MQRIQNVKRTLALILAMMMVLTSTAFANWDSFQGDDLNNGTSETGVTSTNPNTTTVNLPNNGAFTGVDVEPLVHGSRIYALYNGGSTTGGSAKDFTDGKVGGARLAAVDASSGKLLWSFQVGEADNVSQLSTPVLSRDGKTLYGVYTYTNNIFPEDFTAKTIAGGKSDSVTYKGVKLPGSFSNFQVTTGIMGTGKQTGTVEIKDSNGKVVQSVDSDSYDGYSFSVYYTDGDAIPEGTYDITVTIKNSDTKSVSWTQCKMLLNFWQAFKVESIDTDKPVVSMLKASGAGNANTPVTFDDSLIDEVLAGGQLYFGIYDGDRAYYQYTLRGDTVKEFKPKDGSMGFYNAGAVVHDGRVYFGSERGVVYVCRADRFDTVGNIIEFSDERVAIRSSIVLEPLSLSELTNGRDLYFTSYNGMLWRVRLDGDMVVKDQVEGLDLGSNIEEEHSSATPVVSGNNVYVATYGTSESTWKLIGTVKQVTKSFTSSSKLTTIYNGAGVQCSPVVYRNGTFDYVYFTTNVSNGTGYCYRVLTNGTATQWWEAPSGNYSLQGFAAGDGFMTFGNDGNEIIIVK